jgi:hypothetical protein
VKSFIQASKVRAEKSVQADSAHSEPQAEPGQAESACDESDTDACCPEHGRSRIKPSRFGGLYCTGRMENNEFCTFKSKKVAS